MKRIRGKKITPLTYFIYEYEQYKMREKERIEEENTEQFKQKRELEKLEAELNINKKLMHILNI